MWGIKLEKIKLFAIHHKTKLIISFTIVLLLCGFLSPDQKGELFEIITESETYWRADYSEYECLPDTDGGLDCSTDYWSEMVSDCYYVKTKFSELGFEYLDCFPSVPMTKNSFYSHKIPIKYNYYSRVDLDGVYLINAIKVKVYYQLDNGKIDYNTISFNDYENKCKNIGSIITIKTWYGIRYSIK